MVSNEIREKFKKLYQEKFDIALTDEEATQMATDLVNLVKVLVRPEVKATHSSEQAEERRRDETISVRPYQQLGQ